MPYQWIPPTSDQKAEMHLWPHQSLGPTGYMRFLALTAALLALPLLAMLGSVAFWGLLPFLLLAFIALKFALDRSRQNAQILEVLTLEGEMISLHRQRGGRIEARWDCNRYWARPLIYEQEGPLPHYVTLRGNGREVEIGAFLSEEERQQLFEDLKAHLSGDETRQHGTPQS